MTNRIFGRVAAMVAGLIAAFQPVVASAQQAQPYPVQTLRIIVPFGASSGPDPAARRIGERLAEQMGISVVIENREGAGGQIAAQAIISAPPNGSVIGLFAIPPFTSIPFMQKKPTYDPDTQFTHIARVISTPLMIVASKQAPFTNFEQMQDYAKKNPGKLSYATSGTGAASFLSMETVKLALGLDILAVPYKSTGQQMTDTIAGVVALNVVSVAGGVGQVQAGNVRAIAVGSEKRNALMPDVPTIAEASGRPDLEAVVSYGFVGPRGMPEAVVNRLSAEISKAMTTQQLTGLVASMGADAAFLPPAPFGDWVRRSVANSKQVIQTLKLVTE